jgi:hypothetical protein
LLFFLVQVSDRVSFSCTAGLEIQVGNRPLRFSFATTFK